MIFNRLKITKNDKTVNSAWYDHFVNFIFRCPQFFHTKSGNKSVDKALRSNVHNDLLYNEPFNS